MTANELRKGWINLRGVNLRELVKAAFELSEPLGYSIMEWLPTDSLTDDEADEIIRRSNWGHVALHMDYVKGRACKLVVFKGHTESFKEAGGKEGDLFIGKPWQDHPDLKLLELLRRVAPDRAEEYDNEFAEEVREAQQWNAR